jgi:hypothetical protein
LIYQRGILFFEDSGGPRFAEQTPVTHSQSFATMSFEQQLTVKQRHFFFQNFVFDFS